MGGARAKNQQNFSCPLHSLHEKFCCKPMVAFQRCAFWGSQPTRYQQPQTKPNLQNLGFQRFFSTIMFDVETFAQFNSEIVLQIRPENWRIQAEKNTEMHHNWSYIQQICAVLMANINVSAVDTAAQKISRNFWWGRSQSYKMVEFPVSSSGNSFTGNQWYQWKLNTPEVCLLDVSTH